MGGEVIKFLFPRGIGVEKQVRVSVPPFQISALSGVRCGRTLLVLRYTCGRWNQLLCTAAPAALKLRCARG